MRDLFLVVVSPPEVRGKQGVIAGHRLQVLGKLLGRAEVLGVDVAVRRSEIGHVSTIQHDGDDIEGKDVEILLCDIVLNIIMIIDSRYQFSHLTNTVLK